MTEIIHQLGLDETFFVQFGLIFFIFLFLGQVYFKPFQKLLDARHKRTVEDKAESDLILAEMNQKIDSYKAALAKGRLEAQRLIDQALAEAKAEEKKLLDQARSEARAIALETSKNLEKEKDAIRTSLQAEVAPIVKSISSKLLGK